MKTYKELLEAKSDYVIYHETYTSAIYAVEAYVKSKGFLLDKEEMASTVGFGPKKPGVGKTNKFTLRLYKNQEALDNMKPIKKAVHFQIYGMGSGYIVDRYELNLYIS
jgi:hypothetical protein